MASTALAMMTLYLLMSLGNRFAVESSFQDSNIVPDVISTAPPIAAEVRENRHQYALPSNISQVHNCIVHLNR